MSSKSRRYLVVMLVIFLAAFLLLSLMFYRDAKKFAIGEAEKHLQNSLLTHRAIHKYITLVSRPEIYRLKQEGKLYEEYFSPKTMSFTYTARGINDYLNIEREKTGLAQVYFKLASTNPRNVINQADELESKLLEKMNAGELEEYREIGIDESGNQYLYVAMETDPIKKGCLKCHGDPSAAPQEMVGLYPEGSGYYESVGDIRALLSIRIPLYTHLQQGREVAQWQTFFTFILLSLIYAVIWSFIRRSDQQQQIILLKSQELEKLSITDFLTGIYNRMGFMQLAGQAFNSARRYAKPFTLLMLDLDHFKQVNDVHGHDVGDKVLQEMANIINNRLRTSDVFGRFGGEEFIICTIEQDDKGAQLIAEDIRQAVAAHRFEKGLQLTISIGVASISDDTDMNMTKLIGRADKALYVAKNEGRNCVRLYSQMP